MVSEIIAFIVGVVIGGASGITIMAIITMIDKGDKK